MQWQSSNASGEPSAVQPIFSQSSSGIQPIDVDVDVNLNSNAQPNLTLELTADESGAKPKRVRVPIVPDPVSVESIEGLSFDMNTTARHSEKIAG